MLIETQCNRNKSTGSEWFVLEINSIFIYIMPWYWLNLIISITCNNQILTNLRLIQIVLIRYYEVNIYVSLLNEMNTNTCDAIKYSLYKYTLMNSDRVST